MSDTQPTSSEPGAIGKLAGLSISADSKASGTTATASTSAPPSKFNWADEVTTPVNDSANGAGASKSEKTDGSLENAQTDGATTYMNGSAGLLEPEFDVNVKLADLQDDPNNPLYSAKTFEELNL